MSLYTYFLLCFVTFICVEGENNKSKLVKTSQGSVRGYKEPDTNVFVFYGIPYGTAPTGIFKFQAPLPPPAWLQPFEATNRNIICPQARTPSLNLENKKMQEDCLIANVYIPDTQEKNLPVVVYIHGGSFQVGYGDMTPPTKFVSQKNIIGVTFNYRLGVNGFLCLGTLGAPGNAGMKDQVELLRWVKRNIANFGGNPDDITIAGCNAGAISAELLILSKSTKNLFHKMIIAYGPNNGLIAMQTDPLETAKVFAKSLNFTNVDSVYALEDMYKETSMELLTKEIFNDKTNFANRFTPCVERDTKEDYVFLDDAPVNIIKRGKYRKIPILYGFDDTDGLLQKSDFDILHERMNTNFYEFLPVDLEFESKDEKRQVAIKIKEFYFGDKPISKDINVSSVIDYISDVLTTYTTSKTIRLHVEAGHDKIYLYKYTFKAKLPGVPFTNLLDATHCPQLTNVLEGEVKQNGNNINKEHESNKIISELWFNFIKTGKPVPENSSLLPWPPVEVDRSSYVSLGQTIELKQGDLNDRVHFWDALYEKYYRAPIPPPKPPIRHTEL
ncbi:hypothetical protein O3G_MSEX008067 [Manduca sexta]|uniref:Esterase n=2 Tax=Manduca sexta TaxID=7130 RepID=A0A921ZAN0_MANSE|nr:hypothetical protein O3G_MSEX008067 [Manduca sexta]UXP71942.1 esterase [Manduca sexta]